ncbi:MAG TPA: class I SAM-dependent methyltransferase [Propionibacteriaceae bacterium]
MRAEFDTLATWTADAALELGPDSYVAAGCRGSASPSALRWLLDQLDLGPDTAFLDVGAGVGGPAAFAAAETGVRPVLTDPEAGACAAANRLFGHPTARAAGPMPFRTGAVDVIWSLGVVCTVDDQSGFLSELRRVLTPSGRLGLLVFESVDVASSDELVGNHFPSRQSLDRLLADGGWVVVDSTPVSALGQAPSEWESTIAEVDRIIARDHADTPVWTMAAEQGQLMGELIARGVVTGRLLVADRAQLG